MVEAPAKFRLISLVIPVIAALVPVLVYRYSKRFMRHPVASALIAGLAVGLAAFLLMKVPPLQERDALARAVLCGVLVTESLLFHSQGIPSMTSVALFLFLYFYSTEYGKAGK